MRVNLYPPTPRGRGQAAELVDEGVRTEDVAGWAVNLYGDVWIGLYDKGH
jgi:hypothetical protein